MMVTMNIMALVVDLIIIISHNDRVYDNEYVDDVFVIMLLTMVTVSMLALLPLMAMTVVNYDGTVTDVPCLRPITVTRTAVLL